VAVVNPFGAHFTDKVSPRACARNAVTSTAIAARMRVTARRESPRQ
jgi:hypothetical protein